MRKGRSYVRKPNSVASRKMKHHPRRRTKCRLPLQSNHSHRLLPNLPTSLICSIMLLSLMMSMPSPPVASTQAVQCLHRLCLSPTLTAHSACHRYQLPTLFLIHSDTVSCLKRKCSSQGRSTHKNEVGVTAGPHQHSRPQPLLQCSSAAWIPCFKIKNGS